MISDRKFWAVLGSWAGLIMALLLFMIFASTPVKAGDFNPSPAQQIGFSGSWFYGVGGNGILFEVTYPLENTQQPVLVVYWFRVSGLGVDVTPTPMKGADFSAGLYIVGSALLEGRQSAQMFLLTPVDCTPEVTCDSFGLFGSANVEFSSCTEAVMSVVFPDQSKQMLELTRLTPGHSCGD